MESKWVRVLDSGRRIVVDSKRKRAAKYLARVIGASNNVLSTQCDHNSLTKKLGKRKRSYKCITKCGSHLRKSLLKNYTNFMKSGLPQRLLFYQNGGWNDFPPEVVELVREDFQKKNAAIEVQISGSDLMLDILYMIQVDLKTGLEKPIAWIDEAGYCFFPELLPTNSEMHEFYQSELEKDEEYVAKQPTVTQQIKLHIDINIDGVNNCKLEECVEESNTGSKRIKIGQNPVLSHDKLAVNDKHNRRSDAKMGEAVEEFQQISEKLSPEIDSTCKTVDSVTVKNLFIMGMRTLLKVDTLEINRCSSNLIHTRLELFEKQVEITQRCRGNANVQYAWLASSKDAVSSIMTYGLGLCGGSELKTKYGIGIHLAAVNYAHTSASYCDVDENGVQYMVFCRVILGNLELLHHGSGQFHPSCEKYDSGVDDLQNPSHYIVWNMNMNTHIFPEFVVSFKISHSAEGAPSPVGEESRLDLSGVTSQGPQGKLQLDSSSVESVGNCHKYQLLDKSQGKVLSIGSTTSKAPNSPWMPFAMLFQAISNEVSPKDMKLVQLHYDLFRVCIVIYFFVLLLG
ncbi:unnamed protein product [Ilex paraguariensis]|uniref:PARP n=1 Tax=Ilex paraguariensis TaxID=185542 RepID=A0ABC8TX17_9AQUA